MSDLIQRLRDIAAMSWGAFLADTAREAASQLESSQARIRMLEADYERERSENARLRSVLNRITLSPFASEGVKGMAAVALSQE